MCPITQASPFILKKAFSNVEFLSPSIDFIDGYESDNELISYFEREFNIPLNILQNAYLAAIGKQQSIEAEMMKLGKRALELAISENKPAILLVGRSYNAFPNETSQSIGRKLSSKGIITIPYDCLGSSTSSSTTWYFSNLILDAVKLAKKHENLFILYISNFGCSIDSFTQEYLRREMNSKPYLKLEIDSHSADAGTQTRLEAFLDIIQNYDKERSKLQSNKFILSTISKEKDEFWVQTSSREKLKLKDKRVSIHFPIFSKYHGDTLPLAFRWMGYNVPDPIELSEDQLNNGLQFTSGTECLPFPLHIGQINEIWRKKRDDEVIGFYVIPGGAPCVVASYIDILNKYLEDNQIDNVFIFAPSKENEFYGLSKISLFRYFPLVTTFADLMIEIHSILTVVGEENATSHLYELFKNFIQSASSFKEFNKNLEMLIDQISLIPITEDPQSYPKVLVTGDFFVRFDPFFFKGLTKKYSEKGVILFPVGLSEALLYPSYDDLLIASKKINSPAHNKLTFLKAAAVCRSAVGKLYIGSWLSLKMLERAERKTREKFYRLGILPDKDRKSVV